MQIEQCTSRNVLFHGNIIIRMSLQRIHQSTYFVFSPICVVMVLYVEIVLHECIDVFSFFRSNETLNDVEKHVWFRFIHETKIQSSLELFHVLYTPRIRLSMTSAFDVCTQLIIRVVIIITQFDVTKTVVSIIQHWWQLNGWSWYGRRLNLVRVHVYWKWRYIGVRSTINFCDVSDTTSKYWRQWHSFTSTSTWTNVFFYFIHLSSL